jgi:hypothetical protein
MESSHHTTPDPISQEAAQLVKEKYRRLSQRGRICLAIGFLLMGLSFAINLILFHNNGDFSTAMYVLTSLGSGFILYGLGCILGF